MVDQVLLYQFVFSVTGTGKKEQFKRIHYIIPVVLTLAMGIWSLLTPYEVQYYIVETRGENAPGYEWYSRFFSATIPAFIVYNILYPIFGLLRIRKYRKAVVNYSADEQRASVGWLYGFILLVWLTMPIASSVLFVHKSELFTSLLTLPGAFLPIFQYLFICYNVMVGNYVIIKPQEQDEDLDIRPARIDGKHFAKYIKDKKPYLDSKLRITDMCKDLGTNRSYLSAFINNEYGMNFSRYINLRRLEELDCIRSMPKNQNAKGIEMVLDVGFSSYRSYLRVKNSEDERRTVEF
jgi:AraC-like DNA-binding protein